MCKCDEKNESKIIVDGVEITVRFGLWTVSKDGRTCNHCKEFTPEPSTFSQEW